MQTACDNCTSATAAAYARSPGLLSALLYKTDTIVHFVKLTSCNSQPPTMKQSEWPLLNIVHCIFPLDILTSTITMLRSLLLNYLIQLSYFWAELFRPHVELFLQFNCNIMITLFTSSERCATIWCLNSHIL